MFLSIATVPGDVLTLHSLFGPVHYQIINLPDGGGYVDSMGQRYYLGGETFVGPFLIGHSTLIPR